MVGFLKRVFGGSEAKTEAPEKKADESLVIESLPVAKLMELFRHFPLGEKVSYYPEYQKEGALETIVLGYCINDHQIFSPVDLRYQQDDGRDVLLLMVDGVEQPVRVADSFSLLIPFNLDDENKRDYVRRAELGPRGPFRRHNTITLSACSMGGTISRIDTVVRRVQPISSGIYVGHEVVVLDVRSKSLTLTDQRQHYRLQTELPAQLSVRDGETHPCTLLDFSEESVRLRFHEVTEEIAALTEFRRLRLEFTIGDGGAAKPYALKGVMYRKTDDRLVMKLLGIYKDEKSVPLGLVDILDIKANLLRLPETQQALQAEKEQNSLL
jgi:hypothetical protein